MSERSRRTRTATAFTLAATVAALALSSGSAAVTITSLTPGPAPIELVNAVAESVEMTTGDGVSAVNNDNPTTWIGTDGSELGPGELIRYPVYSYELRASALECASYELEVSMSVTADGPDVGVNDNMFLFLLGDDDAFGGSSHVGPAAVGESTEMTATLELTGAQMGGPVTILYGATTHQAVDIRSGYTIGEPDVEIVENLSKCDLDGDEIADDIDPDNTDFCVPNEESFACVESRTTTPVESTTTTSIPAPPTSVPSSTSAPTPVNDPRSAPAALRPTG